MESYTWDAAPDPAVLYVHRRQPERPGVVRASTGLFLNYSTVAEDVEKFTVKEDFRFAVRRVVSTARADGVEGGEYVPHAGQSERSGGSGGEPDD